MEITRLLDCQTCGREMMEYRYRNPQHLREGFYGMNRGGLIIDRVCPRCMPDTASLCEELQRQTAGQDAEPIIADPLAGMGEMPYEPHECIVHNCSNEAEYGKRFCRECREYLYGQPGLLNSDFTNRVTGWIGIVAFCLVSAWIIHQFLN
jgi:hypothetical protein